MYYNGSNAEADMRIHLSLMKPDIKETYKIQNIATNFYFGNQIFFIKTSYLCYNVTGVLLLF